MIGRFCKFCSKRLANNEREFCHDDACVHAARVEAFVGNAQHPLPSGADLLRANDAEAIRQLQSWLLARAQRARENIVDFFEFVMREETTRLPIKCAPHQKVILEFAMFHDRSVIMLPIGHSKCHGKGTPILMADGRIKKVEDVREGERVMGPSGPRTVLCKARGRAPLFAVVPVKGGQPFVVNDEHILTLVHTETDKWIDISVKDYLSKSHWFQSTHKLVRAAVPRFENEQSLEVDPYFLGAWFGDGLHSLKHGVRMTSADPEIIEACEKVAAEYELDLTWRNKIDFSISFPGGKSHGQSRTGSLRLKRGGGRGNPLTQALRECVGDELSMAAIKSAPLEQRLQFLAGFVDADGSVRDNCIYIVQKRRDWADAIAFVARSVGVAVTEVDREVPGYGTYRALCLYGDVDKIPTRVARKVLRPRKQKKDALRSGFELKPLGEGEFFGFTIDGDGRYLLGDFTVTHNTFCMAALTLFMLGQDVTKRGAIISATQGQSEKVVSMVRDYIENSLELKLVFPHLRPSTRDSDSWTQTKITVDRPPGIRDASLIAIGIQGAIAGARLNWIVIDDILTDENTRTQDQRELVNRWVENTIRGRLDPNKAKIVVTNTAWHPDDLPHTLERRGWATLRMQVLGDICVKDDAQRIAFYERRNEVPQLFDSDELRPKNKNADGDLWCRLVANDDEFGEPAEGHETLWPERLPLTSDDPDQKTVETERQSFIPQVFNQIYMQDCRDDASARCQEEWIEKCKLAARQRNVLSLVQRYDGPNPTFTGVDLAVKAQDVNDETAIFTFMVHPSGHRQILDIDIGRYNGPTILAKIEDQARRYNSVVRVEDNAAQDYIRQFVLEKDISIPIKGHTTTASKAASYGVEAIFVEFMNGAWLIPNNQYGQCHPFVQKFIDACLYYAPSTHTADVLMASYFAREQAKEWGLLSGESVRQSLLGNNGLDVMSR